MKGDKEGKVSSWKSDDGRRGWNDARKEPQAGGAHKPNKAKK